MPGTLIELPIFYFNCKFLFLIGRCYKMGFLLQGSPRLPKTGVLGLRRNVILSMIDEVKKTSKLETREAQYASKKFRGWAVD
jgi:hypothetical protein